MKQYYTYIIASKSGTIYTGVTNDLERRVVEHKRKLVKGFTTKYHVTNLVWFEEFQDVNQAIDAEKTIKGWRRSKKVALIEEQKPEWRDLAADWLKE
jgi:putative endonuclease